MKKLALLLAAVVAAVSLVGCKVSYNPTPTPAPSSEAPTSISEPVKTPPAPAVTPEPVVDPAVPGGEGVYGPYGHDYSVKEIIEPIEGMWVAENGWDDCGVPLLLAFNIDGQWIFQGNFIEGAEDLNRAIHSHGTTVELYFGDAVAQNMMGFEPGTENYQAALDSGIYGLVLDDLTVNYQEGEYYDTNLYYGYVVFQYSDGTDEYLEILDLYDQASATFVRVPGDHSPLFDA